MLKKISLFLMLIFNFGCMPVPRLTSPPIDTTSISDANFQKIINLQGLDKQTIFERSKQWLALTMQGAFVSGMYAGAWTEIEPKLAKLASDYEAFLTSPKIDQKW